MSLSVLLCLKGCPRQLGHGHELFVLSSPPRLALLVKLTTDIIPDQLSVVSVLVYADPRLPYILHTDASTIAAFYQAQDGQLRVLTYASR